MLTVCLVTRNAEETLPQALASVRGVANQVVVVDTGSTDRTATLAAELGAEVGPFAWDDDFAAAQNAALAQVRGEWVLWLNPDEELLPESRPLLAACLTRPEAFAYTTLIQQQTAADQRDRLVAVWDYRLFRRHAEVRYIGRCHPRFLTPLGELARREGMQVLPSTVTLRRHVYRSPLTPDKLRWSARLLAKELQDRPGQLDYLIDYGHTLLLLNDPAGHAVLADAAQQLFAFRDDPVPPFPAVQRLLGYLLTVSPEQARAPITRDEAAELARRWFPVSPPLLWALAEQAFHRGDYLAAMRLLETLVQLGKTETYDRSLPFDPSIISEAALLNLGVCYARLGELDLADYCFGQLLTAENYRQKAQEGLDLVRQLRRGTGPER
jgi:tetratricopeptide (TPR) repeat protein